MVQHMTRMQAVRQANWVPVVVAGEGLVAGRRPRVGVCVGGVGGLGLLPPQPQNIS